MLIRWALLLALIVGLPSFSASAQSTAFTYQGQLKASGIPVEEEAGFVFTLWNAATAGGQIGAPVSLNAVPVSNGIFTVQLDFGANAFTGGARWIQVAVNGITLTPRQPLNATPYALYALNGSGTGSTSWQVSGGNLSYNAGNVGIGTTTPLALLHVGSGDILAGAAGEEWLIHPRSATGGDFLQITDRDNGVYQFGRGLVIHENGNVGIGTTAPISKLDVRGDVRMGGNGQFLATGGEENLRIVRGIVDGNGNILAGSGFSVNQPLTGAFDITFTTPFSGPPAVTATATGLAIHTSIVAPILTARGGVRINLHYDNRGISAPFHFIAIGPR